MRIIVRARGSSFGQHARRHRLVTAATWRFIGLLNFSSGRGFGVLLHFRPLAPSTAPRRSHDGLPGVPAADACLQPVDRRQAGPQHGVGVREGMEAPRGQGRRRQVPPPHPQAQARRGRHPQTPVPPGRGPQVAARTPASLYDGAFRRAPRRGRALYPRRGRALPTPVADAPLPRAGSTIAPTTTGSRAPSSPAASSGASERPPTRAARACRGGKICRKDRGLRSAVTSSSRTWRPGASGAPARPRSPGGPRA